jgi:hypothetical protein
MMLTELYYYHANHPAAKATSSSLSSTANKAACTTAVISAADQGGQRYTGQAEAIGRVGKSGFLVVGDGAGLNDEESAWGMYMRFLIVASHSAGLFPDIYHRCELRITPSVRS